LDNFIQEFSNKYNNNEIKDEHLLEILTTLDDFESFKDSIIKFKRSLIVDKSDNHQDKLSDYDVIIKEIYDDNDWNNIYSTDIRRMFSNNKDPTKFKIRSDLSK